MTIKVGTTVKVNPNMIATIGGFDNVDEILPYFTTPGADDYLLSGGTFVVEDIDAADSSGFIGVRPEHFRLREEELLYAVFKNVRELAYITEEALVPA